MPEVPAYVTRWVGKRIDAATPRGKIAGLVIDAKQVLRDHHPVTRLTVAADDGFIDYGVETDWVTTIHTTADPPSEGSK